MTSAGPIMTVHRRRKPPIELGSLARSHTELAIKTLAGIAKDSPNDAARVHAAEILLNRGWGRCRQEITGADGRDIEIIVRHMVMQDPDEDDQWRQRLDQTAIPQ